MPKALKYLALVICTTVILAVLPVLYIISRRLDPQGGANGSCVNQELPVIPNGKGIVVSAHHTVCDNIVHDSAIYVYLHKSEEPDRSGSLIFRYADDPDVAPAKITWANASTVSISVGDVIEVTKQVSSLDGIHIIYSIGEEEIPREVWNKQVYDLGLLELALCTLMCAMLVACWFIVRSLRQETRGRSFSG